MNTKSALLVGVGGQGTILASRIFTQGLLHAGWDVKMSEVHGMAQRGGSVSTQVRWGRRVYSPLIGPGAADMILAFEKMEAVRYQEYLTPEGIVVVSNLEIPSAPIAAGLCPYPSDCLEELSRHHRCIEVKAGEIAQSLGNGKCMNVVLLGAMVAVLNMDDMDWESAIRSTVPQRFLELNLAAFQAGRIAVQEEAA